MPYIYIEDRYCNQCNCNPCGCTTPVTPIVSDCDACAQPDPCTPQTGCPIQLDTACVFYNKDGGTNALPNIGSGNGSTVAAILNAIDIKLGQVAPYNFPTYITNCLKYAGYNVVDMAGFLAAVDDEVCSINAQFDDLNNSYTTQITNLTSAVDVINHPNFSDNCNLGILTTDTLKQVIIKIKDGICAINGSISAGDASPVFLPFDSTTISWVLAGTKNHTPTASVKKSATVGNVLQVLSDGLYVPTSATSIQTIAFNGGTRTLTLSDGGGSVVIPQNPDAQTLSLNTSTKILSISGGNSVNFTPIIPAFVQTSITPNTTNSIVISANGTANTNISADVKVSSCSGNILVVNSDGLCAVPTYPVNSDEKVKASSAGTTTGYLIDKVEGCVSGSTTTTVAYNNITDKVTICSTTSASSLLTEIAATPALVTAFTNLVKASTCFKFRLLNTDATLGSTYSYIDCTGTTFSGLALTAGAVVEFCGQSVVPGDTYLYVFNLGLC